jgi:endo-1,4-beta-xylanase
MKELKTILLTILILHFSNCFSQSEKGLKDYYKNYFPIGVAVSPKLMNESPESALILKEFNAMTPENAMKMGPIHPEENRYNWADADKIADFAVKNNLKLRGHTLCWHNQTPTWFLRIPQANK